MTQDFTHEEMIAFLQDDSIEDRKKIQPMFHYTEGSLAERDTDPVDDLLRDLDVTKVGPRVMIGMLRGNWRAHDYLPHYLSFFTKVYHELERRGEDRDRMLRGMLDWYHEQT